MKRRSLIFAITMFVAQVLCAQNNLRSGIPFRQFSAWLEMFNLGDPNRLREFRNALYPSMDVDEQIGFRNKTGGFTLVKIESATETALTGVLQERRSQQYARVTVVIESEEPHRIVRMPIDAMTAPVKLGPPPALSADSLLTADQIRYQPLSNTAANPDVQGSLANSREFVPPSTIVMPAAYLFDGCSIGIVSGRLALPAYAAPGQAVDMVWTPVNLPPLKIPPPVRRTKSIANDTFRLENVAAGSYEVVVLSGRSELSRKIIVLNSSRCTNDKNGQPVPPTLSGDVFVPLRLKLADEDTVAIDNLRSKTPSDYDSNLKLGLEYDKAGKRGLAIDALTRAQELNSGSMLASSSLGRYNFEAGQFNKAVEWLDQATRLGSTSSDVYYLLGTSYYKLGDLNQAESNLWRALAVDPSDGKPYLQLYNVYMKSNLREQALKMADTYVEKYPRASDREYVRSMADRLRQTIKP